MIQSRSLVYPIFKFEMYSFLIKIAIDDNRAAPLVKTMPTLRFIILIAEVPAADPPPNKILVIINETLIFSKFLYFFLY